MPGTLKAPTLSDLYERDEVAWYGAMIELIDLGRTEALDLVNLKELLESMANRERKEVKSRLRILLVHWLKWHYQPEKRTGSWKVTIDTRRSDLQDDLGTSRVLYNHAIGICGDVYWKAMNDAANETGLPLETFPETCPVNLDKLLAE